MIIRRILQSIRQKIKFRATEGASTVEYGLLIMLIALIAIMAVSTLGTTISSLFGQIDSQIEVADNNSGGGVDTDPPVVGEEEGPIYYPLTNTADDPTHSDWRDANPGYEFVRNDGIYTEEPLTSMRAMFLGGSVNDPDLASWDVSGVTNMHSMFRGATSFNIDISGWNTSRVTDMTDSFYQAAIFNGNIGGWNTSSVTSMSGMFAQAAKFNQDLSGWDTSNVTNMERMFISAASFNQDLSGWCVPSFSSKPLNFDLATTATWTLPKPDWGTCPP